MQRFSNNLIGYPLERQHRDSHDTRAAEMGIDRLMGFAPREHETFSSSKSWFTVNSFQGTTYGCSIRLILHHIPDGDGSMFRNDGVCNSVCTHVMKYSSVYEDSTKI